VSGFIRFYTTITLYYTCIPRLQAPAAAAAGKRREVIGKIKYSIFPTPAFRCPNNFRSFVFFFALDFVIRASRHRRRIDSAAIIKLLRF
jgi:hypothetical protein